MLDMAWMCANPADGIGAPRALLRGPGAFAAVSLTARDIHVSDDMRVFEATDVRATFGTVLFATNELTIRGFPSLIKPSRLSPAVRAISLAASSALVAYIVGLAVLSGVLKNRTALLVAGSVPSLASLGALRALERADARAGLFALVPLVALTATFTILMFARLRRLRGAGTT